jgi:hypothetical protein
MRKPVLRVLVPMCLVVACAVVDARQDAPPKQPAGPQETPSQFYLRYRSTVQSARNLDEVMSFWQRSLVDGFKQAPPDQRADLAGFKRMYNMLSDVNVVSVSIATGGLTATMKLAGKTADGKKMSGTVSLVEEDGGWLAAPEDWQEQSSK